MIFQSTNIKLLAINMLVFANFACTGEKQKNKDQIADSGLANAKPATVSNESFVFNSNRNRKFSQVVRMMFQDSNGDIWFGAEGGAFRIHGDSLSHVKGIQSEAGKGITVKDITEDKKGTIWIGHSAGISRISGDSITNYDASDGLRSNDVWCIEAAQNGKIWIGTIEGACTFDGQKFAEFELPEGKIDSSLGVSSTKMVHDILEDSKGTIWFSTNAGLFAYAQNQLKNASKEYGISTNFVNQVFEDRTGNLWISTKTGLYLLREGQAINITARKIETGKGIGSIAQDKEGKIWFVSNQHQLFSYDGMQFVEFPKTEDNQGPVVFQIYKDQAERMWFVGFGGAFRMEVGRFVEVTRDGGW